MGLGCWGASALTAAVTVECSRHPLAARRRPKPAVQAVSLDKPGRRRDRAISPKWGDARRSRWIETLAAAPLAPRPLPVAEPAPTKAVLIARFAVVT